MNYGDMDIFEEIKEIKKLLDKFPKLDEEELEQLRVLSNNISHDVGTMQYDMKMEKILEEEWKFVNR